ncbi:MAG: glycosyltransferase family 2 protein [Neisseriaceae bacterium]|nr:glycosyltransferase family 2 protein [Neisseriaceae bacterium]
MKPSIALIVPVFNEENNITPFVDEVEKVLTEYLPQIAVVFVDDGSFDNTAQKVIELQKEKPLINLLQLSRNFGKEAAVSAALDTVEAQAYVIIDVDLQHPLSTVKEFIHIWQIEKIDNIYGIRNEKHISSIWFYHLFNKLSGRVKIPVNVSDFRLIDRKVVEILRTLPERNRFMKGLFAWSGLKSRGVPYVQVERKTGSTKFNYPKLWNFALDGIMGFSTLPLRVWSYFGGFVALLAFMYMLWIVANTLIFGIDL